MMNKTSIGAAALFAIALASTGCAAPKILVDHAFIENDKSVKTVIQRSSENGKLFDLWLRVCDVSGGSTEVKCKDSKILANVVPWSLY